jgi:aspartyl-tRNA(Asn)/glutamyl-tRNA(Gln) amidotransferase subunit B
MGEDFETVIGLECHVELSTRTKMFCGCRNEFGAPPNTNVCPVCLGLPGSLPVPNERAIEYIVRIGLALDCEIARYSLFHRKNYFYPDMPKNFQISQYDLPICLTGHLDVQVDGVTHRVGVTRVHMEEDTGKTTHVGASGRIAQAEYALIDYNRAGVPLVEVVSEPDIRSPEEARAYFNELRATLEALDVSDVRMEEGSLRCDANISIRPAGSPEYGTKVEIKNLNSVRSLERALKYEQERQTTALRAGEPLVQETRHFDEGKGTTHTLRSKEEAFDYRYFPEPDLPPLEPDTEWVDRIRGLLPELPAARRARFERDYRLKPSQARILTGSKVWADFFEDAVSSGADPNSAANWMIQDLAGILNEMRIDISDPANNLTPKKLAELVQRVQDGTLNTAGAKQLLPELVRSVLIEASTVQAVADVPHPGIHTVDHAVDALIVKHGLAQVSDTAALEAWVEEAIMENPGPVEQFRAGKDGAINFLVGQVMKKSRGAANVQAVQELLRAKLSGS